MCAICTVFTVSLSPSDGKEIERLRTGLGGGGPACSLSHMPLPLLHSRAQSRL